MKKEVGIVKGCINTQTYLTWVDEHKSFNPLEPTIARSHIKQMLSIVFITKCVWQ